MPHTLILEPGDYAVLKRDPTEAMPTWLPLASFWTVTRAADELSIVCRADVIPYDTPHDGGWSLLRLVGPFAFDQTGILLSVLAPLAGADIGIMAISTFNTDYVLVKQSRLIPAVDALRAAGHTVQDF